MLNTLRENAWITKVIIGAVAIMMIIFFGSDTIRQTSGGTNTKVKVNGTPLNSTKLNNMMLEQMEGYRNIFKGEIPEMFVSSIRAQAINTLINRELLKQKVDQIGLSTPAEELAEIIRTSPAFLEDGVFNKELYDDPDGYRAAYQQRNGTSFTSDISLDQSIQKIFALLDKNLSPTDQELTWQSLAQKTLFKFDVVKISKEPKTDDQAVKVADPKNLSQSVLALWQKSNIEDLLKANNLTKRETGELNLTALKSVFDGDDTIDYLKTIAGLTPEKPFVSAPIETKNFFYVVKLTSLKKANGKTTAEDKESLKTAYSNAISEQLQTSFVADLRAKATIVIPE